MVQFIEPSTLEEDLVRFFLSINNPVLLNTEITFTPDIIDEIYPLPYPNLYKGQQLILSGRYENLGVVDVNLKGKAFNLPVNYDFQISLSDTVDNNLSFIPKLWAKQKLDVLGLDYYLTNSQIESDSISSLIDSLSACYGVIATEFSSFDDNTTEVDEVIGDDLSSSISYFPNPFVDQIHINLNKTIANGTHANVELFTSESQKVFQTKVVVTDGILKVDGLERLEEGIYFLMITTESERFIIKVVKANG